MKCQTLLITKTVLVDCFGNRIRERNQDLDRQKNTVFLSPVANPSVTSWRCLFFFLLWWTFYIGEALLLTPEGEIH